MKKVFKQNIRSIGMLRLLRKRGRVKKAAIEINEIVYILVAVMIIALGIGFFILLKTKGYEGSLETIRSLFRFGRPK